MAITKLSIPYADFKLQEVINPDEFDANNKEIKDKVNEVIDEVLKLTPYIDGKVLNLQNQLTTNTGNVSNLLTRMGSAETAITARATITYVDQKVQAMQNFGISDNSITSSKYADNSVTNAKLASGAVSAAKVDGTTVYTSSQVEGRITDTQALISSTNSRIDQIVYNVDLYSLKQDILAVALNVELLKGAQLTGVNSNMILESLYDSSDITITAGTYNAEQRKVHLP